MDIFKVLKEKKKSSVKNSISHKTILPKWKWNKDIPIWAKNESSIIKYSKENLQAERKWLQIAKHKDLEGTRNEKYVI